MTYKLKIVPSITPAIRRDIEKLLEKYGYEVYGGGQTTGTNVCSFSDITFSKDDPRDKKQ